MTGRALPAVVPATEGHLLGGRVRYTQPRDGFRSGIEPIFLAAAVPARAGDVVLEGGTGAGAALLCLAARVPGLGGVGVELDSALAAMARANALANGQDCLQFVAGDITTVRLADGPRGGFDHAFANPPYHAPGGTPSPAAERERAKRGSACMLNAWATALAGHVRQRGTLTFILPASMLGACLAAMSTAGCAPSAALPLWPRAGRKAKLVLVQGIKGGRAPMCLLSGIVLHQDPTHRDDSGFTPAAEAILRGGAALPMGASPRADRRRPERAQA